ncbi:mucosa-associated lymphoid tissue lymphoma translocation protein 1-like isoform X2 [Corythoichthys intestinalis]|uniref:mucosa-associated lymphoid tissue lymphoma translocation protein 1-like isoform X2 n=1 Tax=Corythoichthys intestinalis TaxID=161448 RepID=UPI0025A5D4C3|nr:mucosa-associated lymphoid tissue lymphoma translocation protein 1-like isoform X2 [Corythoichthys intestinalis]
MAESLERTDKFCSPKDPALEKLCNVLDRTPDKGWRRLCEIVGVDRRFRVSPDEMEICSLKILQPDGSPSRLLLRLLGERGCTRGHLLDFLRTLDNPEALSCLQLPDLQIVIQPESASLLCGHNLRLRCLAVGRSPLRYQWFKGKEELSNALTPELAIDGVGTKDSGFYICRVDCGDTFRFSRWAQVDVLRAPSPCHGGQLLNDSLKVAIQPRPQQLLIGDTLVLECGAAGCPIPRYQWHRDGALILNATRRKLTIANATQKHQGRYRCQITCGDERTWTNEVEVAIDDIYAIGRGSTDFLFNCIPEQPYASGNKVEPSSSALAATLPGESNIPEENESPEAMPHKC